MEMTASTHSGELLRACLRWKISFVSALSIFFKATTMTIRTKLIASRLIAASLVCGTARAALQGRDLNGCLDSFEA